MIDSLTIQIDLIADLKLSATITALLNSVDEIKESQYQGRDFSYPAVRLQILTNRPYPSREKCDHSEVTFALRSYAESASSKSCGEIANAILDRYHRRFFTGTGWRSWFRLISQGQPEVLRDGLWRIENLFRGNVYPTAAP
jgi:hypothetical protein